MPIINEPLTPLGYGRFTAGSVTASNLVTSTPANGNNLLNALGSLGRSARCMRVEIIPEQAIRYRLDGVAPTTTVGNPLPANAQYILDTDPSQFQFISQSGAATVNVEYVGD